jgi:hypothetical protein
VHLNGLVVSRAIGSALGEPTFRPTPAANFDAPRGRWQTGSPQVKRAMSNSDPNWMQKAGDITRKMVQSGQAGSSFSGPNMNLESVMDLAPDVAAMEEDDDAEACSFIPSATVCGTSLAL